MKKLLFHLTILLLFQSCNQMEYSVIGMGFTDTCRTKLMDTLPIILEDYGFSLFHTKYGYIAGKEEDNNYIQLWDYNTGKKVFGFGSIGRGPNEFLMPFCTDYNYDNNCLYIMDIITDKMNKYHLTKDTIEFVRAFDTPPMTGGSLIKFINDSSFVFIKNDGGCPKVVLYNIDQGIISEHEDNILNEKNFKNIGSIYQSSIYTSPYENKVVLKCSYLNSVTCYSTKNNKLKLEWRKFLSEPVYSFQKNELIINHEKSANGLLKDCIVTKSFIFLLVYDTKADNPMVEDFETQLYKLKYSYVLKMNFQGDILGTYKINCVPLYMAETNNDNVLSFLINHPDYNILTIQL